MYVFPVSVKTKRKWRLVDWAQIFKISATHLTQCMGECMYSLSEAHIHTAWERRAEGLVGSCMRAAPMRAVHGGASARPWFAVAVLTIVAEIIPDSHSDTQQRGDKALPRDEFRLVVERG